MMKILKTKYARRRTEVYWATEDSPVFARKTTTQLGVVNEHLHSNSYLIWL